MIYKSLVSSKLSDVLVIYMGKLRIVVDERKEIDFSYFQ